MKKRETEEYRALRATIRERGTARVWVALVGLAVWAALTLWALAFAAIPAATLVPLLLLAATFESIYVAHTGAERVGRYLQVYFETDAIGAPAWEATIMAFGARFPGAGSDPLLSAYFGLATMLNLLPAALAKPAAVEWVVVGTAHAAVIARIGWARRQAATQRARDLERFRQLKDSPPSPP